MRRTTQRALSAPGHLIASFAMVALVGGAGGASLPACSDDALGIQVGFLVVRPEPAVGQQPLEDPTGIDVGAAPLSGRRQAVFALTNESLTPVELRRAQVRGQNRVRATSTLVMDAELVTQWPVTMSAGQSARLVVELEALQEGPVSVEVAVDSDAGELRRSTHVVRVVGVGAFVGEPTLEVLYGGRVLPGSEHCATEAASGLHRCELPPLDFGDVSLESVASQPVTLRNHPATGTCRLPPLPDGTGDCSPVCILQVDRNPSALDVGVGVTPPEAGFALAGNADVPFEVLPPADACGHSGELRLLITVDGGDSEREARATLLLETNAPNARVVEIPLLARVRQGPVAVAEIIACDEVEPGRPCSNPEALAPLHSVYLDGSKSYDPSRPDDVEAIAQYHWEVVEWPALAPPQMLGVEGQGLPQASLWLPVGGPYVVRLTVTDRAGLQSGVSETSDVGFLATADNRLHIELSWADDETDIDLHVVNADIADRVYNLEADCFWHNCLPQQCAPQDGCTPVQWSADDPPYEGANPRLDIDDTEGLGPENVRIDAPRAGRFRIYAHYYALVDTSNRPTPTTLKVFADGTLRAEYSRTLQRDNLWAVAEVRWLDDDGVEVTEAASDAAGQIGTVVQLSTLPMPGGYEFVSIY